MYLCVERNGPSFEVMRALFSAFEATKFVFLLPAAGCECMCVWLFVFVCVCVGSVVGRAVIYLIPVDPSHPSACAEQPGPTSPTHTRIVEKT